MAGSAIIFAAALVLVFSEDDTYDPLLPGELVVATDPLTINEDAFIVATRCTSDPDLEGLTITNRFVKLAEPDGEEPVNKVIAQNLTNADAPPFPSLTEQNEEGCTTSNFIVETDELHELPQNGNVPRPVPLSAGIWVFEETQYAAGSDISLTQRSQSFEVIDGQLN